MRPGSLAAVVVAIAIAVALTFWLTRPVPGHDARAAEAEGEPTTLPETRSAREPTPRAVSPTISDPAPPTSATSSHAAFDAATREAMRELIWHAFGREPPHTPERAHRNAYVLPKEPPPEPEGDAGAIEPKYIQEHVRNEFFDLALGCYNDAMKALPNPTGQVVFWFTIVGDEKVGGIVESVDVLDESTLRDPDMIECMRQSMLSVTFPPPKGGGFVTVKYPISFSPGDD